MMGQELLQQINTIRERTISIQLSDADCDRLAEKAGTVGLSVGDLLTNFVNDLVGGCQSNGSDERMLANAWFDRCGFDYLPDNTFLRWLILYDDIKDFTIHYDLMMECEDDLKSDEPQDPREAVMDDLAYHRKFVQTIYHEYKTDRRSGQTVEPFDTAVERVLKWDHALHTLKGSLGVSAYERYLEQKRNQAGKTLADQEIAPPAEPDSGPEM